MSTALPTEDQMGLRQHSHGAGAPVQTRSARFRSRDVTDFAPVTGREMEWRLSPVSAFTDLLDGPLDGSELPIHTELAEGVTVSRIPLSDPRVTSAGLPEERASANALTHSRDALLVSVTGEKRATSLIRREGLGSHARAAHTVIDVAPHSRALIVLEGAGDARLTENVEILVGQGADVVVMSLQVWSEDSVHLASHFARISRDAKLTHIVVSLGGKVVRVNPSTHLAEMGSDIESLGLYFSDAGQHLEQQVFVHHDAPHTRSRVNFKGALQGKGARSVWVGDVLIGNSATGTDSYEQNRNLVLTEGTRADSIPNLEIETGDIEGAGHASATGRFDDEQLFYLQARGIDEEEAKRLVVTGFLNEVLQKIGDEALESRLGSMLEEELAGGKN